MAKLAGEFAFKVGLIFRRKRMKKFEAYYCDTFLGPENNTGGGKVHILDLGGTLRFWQSVGFKYLETAKITILNLEKAELPAECDNMMSVSGDATDLKEYADKQFDLVFSNSVIEHVGDFNAQRKMANEMMRTGKHYYLQTPNRNFFLEPHFLMPFFQFLPLKVRAFFIMRFNVGVMPKAESEEEALQIADCIRLMTKKELKALFPKAKIRGERFLFMTKSFCLHD